MESIFDVAEKIDEFLTAGEFNTGEVVAAMVLLISGTIASVRRENPAVATQLQGKVFESITLGSQLMGNAFEKAAA